MAGHYPQLATPQQRFVFCPLCASLLDQTARDPVNGVSRPICPACGWIYFPPNHSGALVVIEDAEGLILLHPPGCGSRAPAALAGGIAEFGESPEECAIREVREETGLVVRLTSELCRLVDRATDGGDPLDLGPMIQFGFVGRVVGGALRTGDEGPAVRYPFGTAPRICPDRTGSVRVMAAYLASRESG